MAQELLMNLVEKYSRLECCFRAYVEHDLETADTDYVRDVLRDVCGLTNEELEHLGLDYLIVEEDD